MNAEELLEKVAEKLEERSGKIISQRKTVAGMSAAIELMAYTHISSVLREVLEEIKK